MFRVYKLTVAHIGRDENTVTVRTLGGYNDAK